MLKALLTLSLTVMLVGFWLGAKLFHQLAHTDWALPPVEKRLNVPIQLATRTKKGDLRSIIIQCMRIL